MTFRAWKRGGTMNRKSKAFDILGAVALCAVYALLFWAYLCATPDQASAECERADAMGEVRDAGVH